MSFLLLIGCGGRAAASAGTARTIAIGAAGIVIIPDTSQGSVYAIGPAIIIEA
jgi:hypothetical protein